MLSKVPCRDMARPNLRTCGMVSDEPPLSPPLLDDPGSGFVPLLIC